MARKVHDPYYVEPRKPLTPKQKLKMFIAQKGVCCICKCRIDHVKEAWDEHVNPLWLKGNNKAPNRSPAHAKCARKKTGKEAGDRSKVRTTAQKHFGAGKSRKSPPMPGSRDSKWKRKMNGTMELR